MKAFLLAAGLGTRLRPLTETLPKCLIPIHDKPLLEIWLELLAHYEVTSVLINTHHLADQVTAFINTYRPTSPMEIITTFEPELLGSAGTLWHQRDFVADHGDFIIAYADNLTNINLEKLIDFHNGFRSAGCIFTMGLFHAPVPRQCGIATLNVDGRITDFEEKPKNPQSDLANAGIYVASQDIFQYYNDLQKITTGVRDIATHLLPQLRGRMFGVSIEGYLKDIGTLQAYHQALRQWPNREKINGI